MLTQDEKTGELYIGVTPDGVSFGRDMLSKLSAWSGNRQLDYTCKVRENAVVLTTDCGFARFAIAQPNMLVIEGKGISLMVGNGKTAGIFMGGGSAVNDAAKGALFVTSGVRLRVVPRIGDVEVRSAWDLNALCDPDPQVFIHPGPDGVLGAVIFETDFDASACDDGITVDQAAADTAAEFEAFLNTLVSKPTGEETLHAAYVIWTTLQPARVLNQQCITEPEYVSSRRKCGTAMFYDSVLLAAFLKDSAKAKDQMCSFLKYRASDGLVPGQANNRMFLWEAEVPMFGVVMKARPDICDAVDLDSYQALQDAFEWWMRERFCPERKLFYYLHRFEPGCGKHLPFAETAPEFAPELNMYMVMWIDAMAAIAARVSRGEDAARFAELSETVKGSVDRLLKRDDRFVIIDIRDQEVCQGHPAASAAAVIAGMSRTVGGSLPAVYALPVLLLSTGNGARILAEDALRLSAEKNVVNLRQAVLVLAAENALKGGE